MAKEIRKAMRQRRVVQLYAVGRVHGRQDGCQMLAHHACKIIVSGLSHKLPPPSAPTGAGDISVVFVTQIDQNRPSRSPTTMHGVPLTRKSADFPPGQGPENDRAKTVRLPDPASVETVLAGLEPQSADVELAPALNKAFRASSSPSRPIDDPYWCNPHDVVAADGTRLGDHRAWVEHELAEVGGDLNAFWNRHRQSGEKFAEWRGTTAFAFAPTGPGVADFVQISLGREIELLAGAVVDPDYRPRKVDDLFEPTWILRGSAVETQQLAGPVYRLRGRSGGGIVHMRSFLVRRTRIERELREAQRPGLESRVVREVGPDGTRDTAFFDANPDWFDFVPRESRFFVAWERSSAAIDSIFAHWPSTSTTSRIAAGARSGLFRGPSKSRLRGCSPRRASLCTC